MQELLKSGLGTSLQFQKVLTDLWQNHPANVVLDWWSNSPLGEYYCDLAIDMALKMYYWPMYLAGQESMVSEWLNQLLAGNLCRPGQSLRPMTQVVGSPETV